jgi:hypothetical protein
VPARNYLGDFVLRTMVASAIMTASQYVEIGLTHRSPSDLPVRVIERVLRHSARPGLPREAAGQLGQGTLAASALMLARLMRGMPTVPAIILNALVMSVGNATVVRVVGLGVMPWKWSLRDLATDLTHKTSLSLATRALVERQSIIDRRPVANDAATE